MLDLNNKYIESEEIKCFGISNNLNSRLRATIDEYDILSLNTGSAQDLIDEMEVD